MLKTEISVLIPKSSDTNDDIYLSTIESFDISQSIKNLGQTCYIKIPIKNIDFNTDSISYGDMVINLFDELILNASYVDTFAYTPNKEKRGGVLFDGYITEFKLQKTNITIKVEDGVIVLKKMKRIKMAIKQASMLEILEKFSVGYKTSDDKTNKIFTITDDQNRTIEIHYLDITWNGTFQVKDNISPYEILKMLAESLGINIYTSGKKCFIGRAIQDPASLDWDFAYPYIYGKDYNFVVDINIDQITNNLTQYMIRGSVVKNSNERIRKAYGFKDGATVATFIDYGSVRDNTVNLNFPNITEHTLDVLVKHAWDKLTTEKQKSGNFITYGVPGIYLNDIINLNLYGEESKYHIETIGVNFSPSNGIKQSIMLGKKLN